MRDLDGHLTTPTRPGLRSLAAVALALALAACGGLPADGGSGGEASATPASDDDGPERHRDGVTEIVLLGTSHFAGSATDEHTSRVGDVLSEERQSELDAVARRIADWGPDRYLVECRPDEQATLDSLYGAYRDDAYDPTEAGDRGEIRQLGLRAADRAGVGRMTCADAAGIWLGPRARQVGREHNPEVVEAMQKKMETRLDDEAFLADHTLGEYLLELNSERRLFENHQAYIYHFVRMGSFDGTGTKVRREGDLRGASFALADDVTGDLRRRAVEAIGELDGRVAESAGPGTDYVVVEDRSVAAAEEGPDVGADTLDLRELGDLVQRRSTTWVGFPDHHIGADLVGEWYKRNLRIYANAWRAVEPGTDRVLLMMGQGHVWTLRQFFRENPDFEVVPVDEVLL
jgi:hypothetical protein